MIAAELDVYGREIGLLECLLCFQTSFLTGIALVFILFITLSSSYLPDPIVQHDAAIPMIQLTLCPFPCRSRIDGP
jgi:hypothetical protein